MLEHATSPKRVRPLWSTVKLTNGLNHPVNTVVSTEVFNTHWSLTTNLVPESVAFDEQVFWDAKRYYSNGGMLNKVTGPVRTMQLSRDRPKMFHSRNFTYPMVKRGNPYTYCGMLLWVVAPGTKGSWGQAGDYDAADKDLIHYNAHVTFDEWNQEFDQYAY